MAKQRDTLGRLQQAVTTGSGQSPNLGLLKIELARVRREAERATAQQERFNRAFADPLIRHQGGAVLAMENANRRQTSLIRDQLSLEARRSAVASGAYSKELRAKQLIARETQRVEQIERRVQLQSRYGRFGGAALHHLESVRNHPLARGAMTAVTGVAAAGTGLAMRGFSNTVEMNRFNLELQMVGRELAGAMLPAIQWATKALQEFRKFLETLGPGGQDAVMAGGLVFGGLGAAGLARMGLGSLGLRLGGVAAGGAAAAGGTAGAGAAAGGAAGSGLLSRGGRLLSKVAIPLAIADIAYQAVSGGFYSELRKRGENKFTAGLGAAGGGFMDLLSFGAYGDAFRQKYPRGSEEPNASRRMVTLADSGFDAPGTAFERITNKLALVDAANTDEKSGGGIVGVALQILEEIKKETAKLPPPPMPRGR